jgi:hypothetical protein
MASNFGIAEKHTMKYATLILLIALTLSLSGCLYGQCINGPCSLERKKLLESIKPYSYYWVKDGVTQEQKRTDSKACGAGPTNNMIDNADPPYEDLDKYKRPRDLNDIKAEWRYRSVWDACMTTKGYHRMAKPAS